VNLQQIGLKYAATENQQFHGDKATTHQGYLKVYERLFGDMKEVRLLEVGIAAGLSLKMWREWFGDRATIAGMDISDEWFPAGLTDEFKIHIGASHVPSCRGFVESFQPNIIIDDGSHDPSIQLATFYNLRGYVRPGGFYVIEDTPSIDSWRHEFEALGACDIFDLRASAGRCDNVLVVYPT